MIAGLNVVLVEPEIPPNTGNVGRLCVATRCQLHLVDPLGFNIDDTQLKRAGLDYWQYLDLVRHASWKIFADSLPAAAPVVLFSRKATRNLFEHQFEKGSYLVFGKETEGLPPEMTARWPDQVLRIPMADERVRSLNLSTAVGIAVYEALRQLNGSAGESGFQAG